jgi:glycosyltransferase involved in cell wall biosynthesis
MRSEIAVLTGGGDRPYALGLASTLIAEGISFDFIASDDLESLELRASPLVRFLNLRGDSRANASLMRKMVRVARYYWRLLRYAATAEPRVFHILWNNKLEYLDRTVLLAYYRLLGKRLVHTVHNVNVRQRDGKDGILNQLTLRAQYALVDYLFVHTEQMKRELHTGFGVPTEKIGVIPFGINSTVPDTALTPAEARQRLGIPLSQKVILFFGNIAPYKGLEYLVDAIGLGGERLADCRLLIAGRLKCPPSYWADIQRRIADLGLAARVTQRVEFVPDEETEIYFKAADVLALPYTYVFQSGVLFLGYNFGLPVIAADVGSLKDDVLEGETGFVCPPQDPAALARTIQRYFESDLYRTLPLRRPQIRQFARERYSWDIVGLRTKRVYETLTSRAVSASQDRVDI